jgi:hypothetical protein
MLRIVQRELQRRRKWLDGLFSEPTKDLRVRTTTLFAANGLQFLKLSEQGSVCLLIAHVFCNLTRLILRSQLGPHVLL